MLMLPGLAVVGTKGFYLIVLQVDKLITVGDAAFGYVGAKLTAKHAVQLTSGQVGIVIHHRVDKLVHAV